MTITTETLQRILAEAKAARAPSDPVWEQRDDFVVNEDGDFVVEVWLGGEPLAQHIANLDPATVIAMVEELLRAREDAVLVRQVGMELRAALDNAGDDE